MAICNLGELMHRLMKRTILLTHLRHLVETSPSGLFVQDVPWQHDHWRPEDSQPMSSCFLCSLQSTPLTPECAETWPSTPPDNSFVNNSDLPGVKCCWQGFVLLESCSVVFSLSLKGVFVYFGIYFSPFFSDYLVIVTPCGHLSTLT